MKRKVVITGAVIMAAAVIFYLTREPIVHGRFLTSWTRELYYASGDMTKPDPAANRVEAENAIRSIGTNAIPTLMAELHASDDELWQRTRFMIHRWTASVRHKFDADYYDHGPSFVANERRHAAVLGFQTLGRSALPWLSGLIADPETDFITATHVTVALKAMHPDGCALLLPVLDNPNRDTRLGVMQGISYFPRNTNTEFIVWIPKLLVLLADTSKDVPERMAAANLLANVTSLDDRIIPALIKQIPDRNLQHGFPEIISTLLRIQGQLEPYYPQLRELANNETLDQFVHLQILRLMKIKVPQEEVDKALKARNSKTDPEVDQTFEARYGKGTSRPPELR